jgi:hypothetical protein
MSDYRTKWIELLKARQISGWEIDIHGQAIVIKVPVTDDVESAKKETQEIINELSSQVDVPKTWLKFIFYNGKMRFEHILNPELRK